MLIKEADDHRKRLALLETLQNEPRLNRSQRDWLTSQIWALRLGASGERNAAYYIDHHFKDSQNHAVIHDLRLEMDDEVAQIDHLIISRGFMFYLLETKNFSGNLSINEHGEFTVHYPSGRRGIPSPLEQSKRHEKVLSKWLDRLEITGRLGSKPQFFHAVLIDPKGMIERPDPRKFDTGNIIKADHIDAWRTKHVDKVIGFGQTLTAMVNLRGGDTVREWAEKLVRQHRPLMPQQWLPDFMKPSADASPSQPMIRPKPHRVAEPAPVYAAIQQAKAREQKPDPQTQPVISEAVGVKASDPRKRKLVCCTCDAKITFEEGKFCWNNERRFGGLQYCRTHQADFR